MNCEIIFYLAKKTSLCEKALKKEIGDLRLQPHTSFFATTPESLGVHIINSLERSNVVFLIGGLGNFGKSGVENVLSKALAYKTPDELKKLRNPISTSDGYLIRQGGQLIIVLPDEPEEIQSMFDDCLISYLEKFSSQ
jgi:hypothetical protein